MGQQNAGFLYAHAPLPLRAATAPLYSQRAMQYLKLAALQGSKDAQVQLAALLADRDDHTTANQLFKEAAQGGSRDALWHLGIAYLHGRGVERSFKTAVDLFQSAGVQSKYGKLNGLEAVAFRVATFVYEARVPLLLGAALLSVLARGGDPMEMLQGVLGGGARPVDDAAAYEDDDGDDDFAFDDDAE